MFPVFPSLKNKCLFSHGCLNFKTFINIQLHHKNTVNSLWSSGFTCTESLQNKLSLIRLSHLPGKVQVCADCLGYSSCCFIPTGAVLTALGPLLGLWLKTWSGFRWPWMQHQSFCSVCALDWAVTHMHPDVSCFRLRMVAGRQVKMKTCRVVSLGASGWWCHSMSSLMLFFQIIINQLLRWSLHISPQQASVAVTFWG